MISRLETLLPAVTPIITLFHMRLCFPIPVVASRCLGAVVFAVLLASPVRAAENSEVKFGFYTTISNNMQAQFSSVFDPILKLLGQKFGKRISMLTYKDQNAFIRDLKSGRFHYGYSTDFMGYIKAKELGVKPMLTLKLFGKDKFPHCLYVPSKSPIKNLADLKGKRAIMRPMLEDYAVLREAVLSPPEKYFSRLITAKSPDGVFMAMREGIADVGVAPEIVVHFVENGLHTKVAIRSLACGPAIPPGPLFQTRSANPVEASRVAQLLLNLPRDPGFKNIKPLLARFKGEFIAVNEKDFEPAYRLAKKAVQGGWLKAIPK